MISLSRLLLATGILALGTGCAPQVDDLIVFTNQVKQNSQPRIEPYPEFTQQPAFQYSAFDTRSPFSRPKITLGPVVTQTKINCLQPDTSRTREPLEAYGIDALSLTGRFRSNGADWVLFKTNDGGLYQARKGSRVGLFFGRIIEINNKKVVIEELVPDGTGCWQKKETTLSMSS